MTEIAHKIVSRGPAPQSLIFDCRLQTAHVFEPVTDKFGKTDYRAFLRVYDDEVAKAIEAMKIEVIKSKVPNPNEAAKILRKVNGNPNCRLLRIADDCYDDVNMDNNGTITGFSKPEAYAFMKVSRKVADGKPACLDRRGRPVEQTDGLIVSGAHVRAYVQFWYYDNQSTGVGATLIGLQWIKEGEPFTGAPKADASAFGSLDSGEDESEGNPFV